MAGTLSATIAIGTASNPAFAGGSALAAEVIERYAGSVGLTGVGALDATSMRPQFASAAALNGTGVLVCSPKQIYQKLMDLLGGGSLGGTGKQLYARTASLGGGGALSATAAPPPQPDIIASASAAGSGVTSMALPAHQVGDLILLGVSRTNLSKPAAGGTVPNWITIDYDSAAAQELYMVYAVATATNHTSGVWANGSGLSAVVIRGQKSSGPIGAHAQVNTISTAPPINAPAVTMTKTDGSSLLLHMWVQPNSGRTWSAPATGYTRLTSSTGASNNMGYQCVNSKDDTHSDGAVSQGLSSNPAGSTAQTVEILGP